MKYFFYGILYGSLISISGLVGTMVADRREPIVYYGAKADPATVTVGSYVHARFPVNRKRSCPLTVHRVIFDSAGTRFTLPSYSLPPVETLGESEVVVKFQIPTEAEPGPAVYKIVVEYFCNPVQKLLSWPILVAGSPLHFEIVRPDRSTSFGSIPPPPFAD